MVCCAGGSFLTNILYIQKDILKTILFLISHESVKFLEA